MKCIPSIPSPLGPHPSQFIPISAFSHYLSQMRLKPQRTLKRLFETANCCAVINCQHIVDDSVILEGNTVNTSFMSH